MRYGRIFSVVTVLGLAVPASAAMLVVDLNGSADYTDIQPGIDDDADPRQRGRGRSFG